MEVYYHSIFLVLTFFQEELEGMAVSVYCFIFSLTSVTVIKYFEALGFNFFEAAFILDFILFVGSFFFLTYRFAYLLILSLTLSLSLNMTGIVLYGSGSDFYIFLTDNYKYFNYVFLEIVVWSLFLTSTVYDYLKGLQCKIKERLWGS